uniref:Uncharacterized protein n=1 Tax=Helianthus annuus TaxID=4232 RepID=A0A251SKD4_HELAN
MCGCPIRARRDRRRCRLHSGLPSRHLRLRYVLLALLHFLCPPPFSVSHPSHPHHHPVPVRLVLPLWRIVPFTSRPPPASPVVIPPSPFRISRTIGPGRFHHTL